MHVRDFVKFSSLRPRLNLSINP